MHPPISTYSKQNTVYIDSVKLLNQYQGMIDDRAEYQQKAATWKANIDTLSVEVQNAIKSYEKESISMTKKEKDLSQEFIWTKQCQLMDYQSTAGRWTNDHLSSRVSQCLHQTIRTIPRVSNHHGC